MTNTRIEQVLVALLDNNDSPGITASQIAKKTRMSRKSVMNRVSDLRNLHGEKIFTNVKRNTTYYRIAA